uniref:MD-2-related lipid-recognition domain-containing protein n=1 Tax=Glossina palpalis gambiensis TaxID=67801 RepID=A0A1B0AZU4_9MUSC
MHIRITHMIRPSSSLKLMMYDAEGKNKFGCPLKAGETCIYRNSFKILPVYPTVSVVVHWGLGDKDDDVVCFEVPAKIKA